MTEYTVRTEYLPDDEGDTIPWRASLLDGNGNYLPTTGWGATREEAVEQLQGKLRARNADPKPEEFTANALGEPLEQPSGHMMGET